MKKNTLKHPKVYLLADEIGQIVSAEVKPYAHLIAIGVVESLTHWARQYAPDGDIGKWDDSDIAEGLGWPYERCPVALIDALVNSRWLDRDSEYRLTVNRDRL